MSDRSAQETSLNHRILPLIAALLTTGAALAAPAEARADSSISGVAEIKLGGYYPSIDDEFGGSGPFSQYFGTDSLWYFETEWDFYVWDRFGKLGFGLHLGWASVDGNVRDDSGATLPGETTFRVIPIRASAVYRYDYSALHHDIPLVPVFKLGLDYVFWRAKDSAGDTSTASGINAVGGTMGFHGALGLHFLLDVIDPASAAYLDLSWGVNNSYLFAEYMVTKIDDFGGASLDLSDNMLLFGLAFEF